MNSHCFNGESNFAPTSPPPTLTMTSLLGDGASSDCYASTSLSHALAVKVCVPQLVEEHVHYGEDCLCPPNKQFPPSIKWTIQTREAMVHEAHIYAQCERAGLQGVVVPRHYGLYSGTAETARGQVEVLVSVLQDAGPSLGGVGTDASFKDR